MKKIASILGIGLPALLMVGCADQDFSVPKTDIVAVYMHHVGDYSVAKNAGEKSIVIERLKTFGAPTVIINDVMPDESMWYSCQGTWNSVDGSTSEGAKCEIHIRNIDDINGAGYTYGKGGRGTTERIQ